MAAIVAAAIELGPDATLAAIAQRAGVGTASLHRYFPTTNAIFAEVSRQMFRTLVDQVRALTARPDVALRDLVGAVCGAALQGPNVSLEYRRRLNLDIPLSWSQVTAEEAYEELIDELVAWYVRNLPNPPSDLRMRIFVAFASVRGVVLVSLLFPRLAPANEEMVHHLTDTIVRSLRANDAGVEGEGTAEGN